MHLDFVNSYMDYIRRYEDGFYEDGFYEDGFYEDILKCAYLHSILQSGAPFMEEIINKEEARLVKLYTTYTTIPRQIERCHCLHKI